MITTMVDRIKQVMVHLQMSAAAFAESIGIGRSNLTHIFSGRNQPSLDVVRKILGAFPNVSPDWLILGNGPMLREHGETPAHPVETTHKDPNLLLDRQTDLFAPPGIPVEQPNTIATPSPLTQSQEEPQSSTVYKSKHDDMDASSPEKIPIRSPQTNISVPSSRASQISDSRCDRKITKIVFFFEDRSFEIYVPTL